MSRSEAKPAGGAERDALQALEGAVGSLLERVRELSEGLSMADAKRGEAEDLLKRVASDGKASPEVHAKVRALEDANVDLRRRLDEGRESVERLLAKIRFLEEHR